jgi:hypothetical protein
MTITCVENTYIPDRAGTTRQLAKVGKCYAEAGEFRVTLPVRIADIEWLDADTARWALNNPRRPVARLDGHTVTYRLPAAS